MNEANVISGLKSGRIPSDVIRELSPFSLTAHNEHVAMLNRSKTYDVFGHLFDAGHSMYHPHPWSSSVFMVRSLLREQPALGKLLELGCGTGTVGLSMIGHGLADHAVITDIDADALVIARRNACQLEIQGKTDIRHGDLFAPVMGERFNSIIFNLPLMHTIHPGLKHISLDDACGELAHRFFSGVHSFLEPGGIGYFTFSNISHPNVLETFSEQVDLSLVAAEWVVSIGFWLMVYRFKLHPGKQAASQFHQAARP